MAVTDNLGLSPEQVQFFEENGYLLIPDALSQETVAELLAESHKMLKEFPIESHPMTKFSTGQGEKEHVGDDYFLESGDKIRFFFEEDAFDASGNLTKPKDRAINKIGHYLHQLSPPFRSMSLSARNAAIARSLGFRDPRVLQSMVICKQPEIGGAVPPHQDSPFLYTDPPSAVGFWYALEDCTASNGCLSFAPGSHRTSPVRQRFVRMKEATGKSEAGGTGFVENKGAVFPPKIRELREKKSEGMGPDTGIESEVEYTMGEVKAGTLVLIHGNVLHKSEKNLSEKSRFIYTFHCIEGENEYDRLNWLQPPAEGFSKLPVNA
ncbi:Phytanoyl-CoA dioxygenase domain-containing protein 1-like protein [Lasiodiplodia hormozganensis]|uniref:Phytanoyl-CoA dioxygenase domain-containing protein 1-like protein n=1 Tax=Lasiodiplodia hormozganensis TaxID=869390 RepID=A0AA39W9S1_9PEZI|nr:Phytanoyl-CoA dioxygenase domain-containing protein 1-like protein [Lasiodiplodia hormozganensis]